MSIDEAVVGILLLLLFVRKGRRNGKKAVQEKVDFTGYLSGC